MTNLHNDDDRKLINFLRQNRPVAPSSPNSLDLEQKLMTAIAKDSHREHSSSLHLIWAIPSAITTGFLLTSVGLNLKTPQMTIESEELEKFLVDNWQDTLSDKSVVTIQEESDWLLPTVSQPTLTQPPKPTLSLSSSP